MSLKDEIELANQAYKNWEMQDRGDNSRELAFAKRSLLMAIQQELTEVQRKYLVDYITESLTMEDIANRYGVNKSTVSRTINRATRKLFKALRYATPYTINATQDAIRITLASHMKSEKKQKKKKKKTGT